MHVVMFVDKRTQASRFEVFFSFNLHGCDYVVVLYQEINFLIRTNLIYKNGNIYIFMSLKVL